MTAVKEEELPLVLPKTENIRPSGTGESPLANIDEWVNVVDPETGKKVVVKQTQCHNGLVAAGTTYVTSIQTIAKHLWILKSKTMASS